MPQYILFHKLGFINTFVPLILPKFLATDAFFVFLMVQFIRGIPRELDEAARLDGCGHWRIFCRVMLPLWGRPWPRRRSSRSSGPGTTSSGPLIYLTDPIAYTVPVALRSFLDSTSGSNWGANVRHVDRLARPPLPRVPVRPAVPGQGHRHHRQMSPVGVAASQTGEPGGRFGAEWDAGSEQAQHTRGAGRDALDEQVPGGDVELALAARHLPNGGRRTAS